MLNLSDLIAVAAISFLAAYLGAYTRRKGENLATKEDVAEITRQQEKVRDEFQKLREEDTQKHQLRLAALDSRLQKHQEAYTLWWKLRGVAAKRNEVGAVVLECQDWWVKNCFYLDADAREAFYRAYLAAHLHPTFFDAPPPRDSKTMMENWQTIEKAGEALERGVQLPAIHIASENHELHG